ncbi:MAG: glycosyltransferase [Brevundimonas sp.]|nr:MAG: glycosyltransferase [Brevundimonas sp.]
MPKLSILMPTRERASYLPAAIQSCLSSKSNDFELVVLDNASLDDTADVVRSIDDPRLRYLPSDSRLSMRDNFERGLDAAEGDIISFVGDDDGVFSFTPEVVIETFERHEIEAISARRAHYAWPDLLSSRRGTGLLPRGSGMQIRDSREVLRSVLDDNDYYKLPCLYHGFVSRPLVDRIKTRDGRFFHSSQVDMYSAITLSMEEIRFAYFDSPLVINGGSARSNGAAHFGGGSSTEKTNWKKEDELGFLPGFEGYVTVGSLIVESALRYCMNNPKFELTDIFDIEDVERAMASERRARIGAGANLEALDAAVAGLGLSPSAMVDQNAGGLGRVARLGRSFLRTSPVDMTSHGVRDVDGARRLMEERLNSHSTGWWSHPVEEMVIASRIAFGK